MVIIMRIRDTKPTTVTRRLTVRMRVAVDMTITVVHLFFMRQRLNLPRLHPTGKPQLEIPRTRNRRLSCLTGSTRRGIVFRTGTRMGSSSRLSNCCGASFRTGDLAGGGCGSLVPPPLIFLCSITAFSVMHSVDDCCFDCFTLMVSCLSMTRWNIMDYDVTMDELD